MFRSIKKTTMALALMLIMAFTSAWQAGVSAQAPAGPDVPLAPGLKWKDLGPTNRIFQINEQGDALDLTGKAFQAEQKFTGSLPEAATSFYSEAALANFGWKLFKSIDADEGNYQIFSNDTGFFLTVESLQCEDVAGSTCLTVWLSANKDTASLIKASSSPFNPDVTPQALFYKKTPANGATGLNPLSTYLSWTAYTNAQRYSWCVKQGDTCANNDPNWTGTFNLSKTVTDLNPNVKYYWEVKATTCWSCIPKPWVYADNKTWWTFNTTTGSVGISGNAGVSGAVLTYWDGSSKTATADSNGDYSFRVSYNWTGTVTPYKTGFVFSPPSRSYSNLTASLTGQNFIASTGMQISGNVGVAGATLSFTDGVAKSVSSDSNGNYKINISYGWSGTITPSKTGYIFTPTNRQYFVVTSNLTGQNYTAQLIRYSIAGNAGVGGATLTYFDGITKTVTATSTGFYTVNVPYNWSGKITPSKAGVYSFTPAYRSYSNVTATITGQNYLANYRAAFASSGIYDGQILESTQGSGVGGSMNSTGVNFAVGDDAHNTQYRSILSFPTGQLPDTAVVISAKLKLTLNYIFGTNPMTTNGALVIDLAKPVFGTLPNLQLVDFNAAASLNQAGTVAAAPVNNVFTGNFVSGALPLVNKLGLTQLRLRFATPSNNDNGSDFMLFYSGDNLTYSYRPVLEIIYRLP